MHLAAIGFALLSWPAATPPPAQPSCAAYSQLVNDLTAARSRIASLPQEILRARTPAGRLAPQPGARNLPAPDERAAVREALDRLMQSAGTFEEDAARAVETLKYTGQKRAARVWGERTRGLPRATAQLQGAIGTLSGPPANMRTASAVLSTYQKLTDDLLRFLDQNGGRVPASDAGLSIAALQADAAAAGLDAGIALASLALSLADVDAAQRYAADARTRLPVADVRIRGVGAGLVGCPNPLPQPGPTTSTAQPARPVSTSPTRKPAAGPGRFLLFGGIVAGAGAIALAIVNTSLARNSVNGPNCSSSQSQAIAMLRQADTTCSGPATNPVIIACNQAQQTAVQSVTSYCACLGKSFVANNVSYTQEISLVQNGGACR